METTLKANWQKRVFSRNLHEAIIGNGLLHLFVDEHPTKRGKWKAQVNGFEMIDTRDEFDSLQEAQEFIEARAALYLRSMLSELGR